jgi:hypothetical protein
MCIVVDGILPISGGGSVGGGGSGGSDSGGGSGGGGGGVTSLRLTLNLLWSIGLRGRCLEFRFTKGVWIKVYRVEGSRFRII